MLINEFEKIWIDTFKDSTDKLLMNAIIIELQEAGILDKEENILKNESMQKFVDIWVRFRADESNLHMDECAKIRNKLLVKQIIFNDEEMQAKIELKINMERDLIRWIIYHHITVRDGIKDFLMLLIGEIKLEPKHFTDIVCQSLYRLIIYKFSKGRGFGLTELIGTKDDENNYKDLGFIPWREFKKIVFPDEGRGNIVNNNFDSMVDYAIKIMMMCDLIGDEA